MDANMLQQLARGLETLNESMLPAALMVPTAHGDHLLLRAHTAPPAAPKVFSTNTRCPYMVRKSGIANSMHARTCTSKHNGTNYKLL